MIIVTPKVAAFRKVLIHSLLYSSSRLPDVEPSRKPFKFQRAASALKSEPAQASCCIFSLIYHDILATPYSPLLEFEEVGVLFNRELEREEESQTLNLA